MTNEDKNRKAYIDGLESGALDHLKGKYIAYYDGRVTATAKDLEEMELFLTVFSIDEANLAGNSLVVKVGRTISLDRPGRVIREEREEENIDQSDLEKKARKLAAKIVKIDTIDGKPTDNLNEYLNWFFETTRELDLYHTPLEAAFFAYTIYSLSTGDSLKPASAHLVQKDRYKEITGYCQDGICNITYWCLADLGRAPRTKHNQESGIAEYSPNEEYLILRARQREMLKAYMEKTDCPLFKEKERSENKEHIFGYWREIFDLKRENETTK